MPTTRFVIVKRCIFHLDFLGSPIKEKIAGSELFPAFCTYHKDNLDIRIFLLGAAPDVTAQAQQNINASVGRDIVVGAYSPSSGFEEDPQECTAVIERINCSGATVYSVGVGSLKQERWIYRYREQLLTRLKLFCDRQHLRFCRCNLKNAPTLGSKLGVEQLFHLMGEHRQSWKRYLTDDLPFLWLVLKQKLLH